MARTRVELVEFYESRRTDLLTQIDSLTNLAMSRDNHELTDQDREALGRLQTELGTVNRDLEAVAVDLDLSQRAREAIRTIGTGQVAPSGFRYQTAGEALCDLLRSRHLGDEDARVRYRTALETQNRAAEHMGTIAANTTPVAGGFDGLIVTQSLGPIVQLYPTDTPFLTLVGPRNVPGLKFSRPRLVDPDLLTAAGPHAGDKEKGEVPSKKWDYASDLVATSVTANYINLSIEASELVPASIQMVIDHLRLRTSLGLESKTVAEAAKTGKKITLAANADAAAVQKAVWDAMAAVFIATGRPAEWLAAGPLGTAMLGSSVDLAGRPVFPFIGAANAVGTAGAGGRIIAPFGLSFAETFAITDTTLYVGNSLGLEAYLRWLPVLQAPEPSVLGVQIGVGAMSGFFHPTTKEAVTGGSPTPAEYNAIVKIAP
jgi:hypothetical protein